MTPAARTCGNCLHRIDGAGWDYDWCALHKHDIDPSAWCAHHTPTTPTAPARAETDDELR